MYSIQKLIQELNRGSSGGSTSITTANGALESGAVDLEDFDEVANRTMAVVTGGNVFNVDLTESVSNLSNIFYSNFTGTVIPFSPKETTDGGVCEFTLVSGTAQALDMRSEIYSGVNVVELPTYSGTGNINESSVNYIELTL